jgi:hypothetical protein
MRQLTAISTFTLIVSLASSMALGAQPQAALSDADYIARVDTAAPAAVVKTATIVRMDTNGTMRALQKGTNGFTCMVTPDQSAIPMCADQNAMLWLQALVNHTAPPNATGFVYMLSGDAGASNSDPYATAAAPGNHWVKTGPHVMIVGPAAKTMGYPATLDPDASKPYVMWPNSPYAHLMIPVTNSTP